MAIPLKTGVVIATLLIKHLCRVLTAYRPKMDDAISAAVTAGHISSTQQAVLKTWLDGAQVACDIIRLVSGY